MTAGVLKFTVGIATIMAVLAACDLRPVSRYEWTEVERAELESLWLESLPALAPDPSNAVADNPLAAALGRRLFFEPRLSANGGISCATCHQVERRFTDGLQKAQAIGQTDRHTPSIVGSAYSPWQFWDGRRDSQWAQALAPLEDANEHATNRTHIVSVVLNDVEYRQEYEQLFGVQSNVAAFDDLAVNTAFANIGKSIAAFERTVMPTNSRYDDLVDSLVSDDIEKQDELFSDEEVRGLRLFIGEANCTQCHNGPLLTNHEFHNTGLISFPGDVPDKARADGVREVLVSEFGCRSRYSDDPSHQCDELKFARRGPELIGAFKTPSLRNLQDTAPFMHKGQLPSIASVLQHYNQAADAMIGHNEAKPLGLSRRELQALEAFLLTLSAPFVERQFESM